MRYRERIVPCVTLPIGKEYYGWGSPPQKWYLSMDFGTRNSAFSAQQEYCYDEIHGRPPYLEGGPFNKWSLARSTPVTGKGVYLTRPYGGYMQKYDGGFITIVDWKGLSPAPTDINWYRLGKKNYFPDGNHTWGDVSSYGPTAWKRFRPGRSPADVAVFLGEIRDTPRMLKTTARAFNDLFVSRFGRRPKKALKKASEHWLNTQFGWIPFLSDLRSFYLTWKKADKLVSDLMRMNNRWIKRGGTVVEREDVEILSKIDVCTNYSQLGVNPALSTAFHRVPSNLGKYTLSRITAQRVWFEARFRYYIPNIESVIWKQRAYQQLFGLSVTPALVWELIPWSWLVDWFSNVGDVISNLDTGLAQNLVAKYAYVMGTTESHLRQLAHLDLHDGPVNAEFTFDFERKQRTEANPFGFGLTWDNLSLRQWSILGALGFTRLL